MTNVAGMGNGNPATPGGLAPDASGHRPVLLHPLIASLQPAPGSTAVDGTLGAGGVAGALLERVVPGGRVLGVDRDPTAVAACRARFARAGTAFIAVHGNFAELDSIAAAAGIDAADAVALDLGISSLQLDDGARGFSFQLDGPLDMRLDPGDGITAADLVNTLDAGELSTLLRTYGDERFARQIAAAILRRRPLSRTSQLRALIEATVPRRFWPRHIHPATRTFQALRIAVNDELSSLERGLQASIRILRPGGRLGVVSFHSLEDTLVKNTLHVAAQHCLCPPQQPNCTCAHRATLHLLSRKAIRPDAAELSANPRARSARLRIAEKLAPIS